MTDRPLSKRERLKIDRQEMPTSDAAERSRSFTEVNVDFPGLLGSVDVIGHPSEPRRWVRD